MCPPWLEEVSLTAVCLSVVLRCVCNVANAGFMVSIVLDVHEPLTGKPSASAETSEAKGHKGPQEKT